MKRKKYELNAHCVNGYVRLGNAIVETAANDYRQCLAKIKKHPHDNAAKAELENIESFFHSRLYGTITTIEPELMIRKLREEYGVL